MKKLLLYLLILIPFLVKAQVKGRLNLTNILRQTSLPSISLSTFTLQTFTNQTGTASSTQPITVTFNNTSNAGAISVPSFAQASVNGGSYGASFSSIANGTYTVTVRISASTAAGSYGPSNIVFTGTGATTQNCSITATVSSASPTLTVSPTSVTIPATTSGTQSQSVSFNVNGSNLSGSTISVSAPANAEVSTNNSSFTTNVTVPISGGNVTNYPVYVVSPSSASPGTYTGYVQLTTTGISGSVPDTVTGVVNSSSTATLFVFERTNRTIPSVGGVTVAAIIGDPYQGILTNTANGITLTTGSISAWQAFGSPLLASSDSIGMLGSTISGFPDSLLYGGFYTVSGSNRLADSGNQTLSKPNFVATGLTVGHTYTISIYSSLNTRYSGFHSNVHATAVGSTTYASSVMTLLGNTNTAITFTLQPDGTGTIKFYLFTDGASTDALNDANGIKFQP
jgi:hypothetical protein